MPQEQRPKEKPAAKPEGRSRYFRLKHFYADAFAKGEYPDLAKKLHDCEETDILAACTQCGHSWYVTYTCRQRVCPLCSYRVAQERKSYLLALTKQMKHPKLLTLTMPIEPIDPHGRIKFLRQCFSKLRRTAFFSTVKGGAYQIEVKVNPLGYHVHLHALLDAPFLPYQKIFSEWSRITNVKAPQVDIRAASSDRAREYVCKYTVKSAGFDSHPETIVQWYEATKGERLFATFGDWYNAKLEELCPGETEPEFIPTCPHCGALKSTIFARDGPFIFGPDLWRQMEGAIVGSQPLTRPKPTFSDAYEEV
jgi:hypothetical protein